MSQLGVPDSRIRVVIADSYPVVRRGIRHEIESQADMVVVRETADGCELLDLVKIYKPHVVILDVKLDHLSGAKVTRCLNTIKWYPPEFKPKIVVYSSYFDKHYIWSLLGAGARGYLLKSDPPEKLLQAIREVHAGKTVLSQRVQTNMIDSIPSLNQELNDREIKIMQMLAGGQSDQEIACNLNVSRTEVEAHLNNIYRKIPWIRSRAEAVVWAWINHMIPEPDMQRGLPAQ